MAHLTVPERGLTLLEPPASKTETKIDGKPLQIMELDLADGVLQEIFKSARHGGKGVNLSFGKTIMLHYGNRSHHLTSTPSSSNSQLYNYSTEDRIDLAFAGRLSHKLAMQKAKDETAGADEALAILQSQLASHKTAKQSMQIKFVPDSSKLPPPVKQTAATAKHHSVTTNSLSVLKKNYGKRSHFNHDTTRSMPASPSLGAAHTPTPKATPTSIPSPPIGKIQRVQALRTPLIHFLAARPASTNLLTQHLSCKQDELLEVIQKVGKEYRLDASKWDLTDKIFKELDVWTFDYPNQGDRELAIGRARSAFDRMRVSTKETLWDKLLPKHERGKGKVLSQLNLHKGPIQQSSTPKIQIQHPSNDSSKVEKPVGYESDQKDRLAPSDAEPMGRSKSQGPIKRTKVSEKEAQSRRLLSNGPKKTTADPKVKEAHPAVKKGDAKKKDVPKSSEFVNDSDEEDGLEDATTLRAQSGTAKKSDSTSKGLTSDAPSKTPKPPAASHPSASTPKWNGIPKPTKATEPPTSVKVSLKPSQSSPAVIPSQSKVTTNKGNGKVVNGDKKAPALPTEAPEKKPLASGASSPVAKHRISDGSQGPTAMKKTLSRQRTTSSPHKPSPLGSSPPTNASDLENTARSSSSSTPLVAQAKNNATTNGLGLAVSGHARNTSEHTLKRKAGELDSGIHYHGSPLTNGNVNGHIKGDTKSAKRQKTYEVESPSSDSSDSPLARNVALKKAQDFKKYYANYEKQYLEVSQMKDAPQEKIDALTKMHHRLAELKEQISRGLVGS